MKLLKKYDTRNDTEKKFLYLFVRITQLFL